MADPGAGQAPSEKTRDTPLAEAARHPWLVACTLLAIALVVLVVLWDWNWFKGPIERQVQARTGRTFDIAGNLDVDLGRVTTIRADGLRLGNAQWSKSPDMATVRELQLDIRVWPLLRGDVRIPRIVLDTPRLRLEKGPKGVGNWVFDKQGSQTRVQFTGLRVDDGRLQYIDPAAKTNIDVAVTSGKVDKPDAAPPIQVDGGGTWQGNKFTVQGQAQSPLDLHDEQRPYRIDVHAQAGATKAHARGTLLDPLQLRNFDLKLALVGQDLADLYPLLGLAIPETPPYSLDGRLTRDIETGKNGATKTTWHYDDFTGKVGDSDLGGNASVTTGGVRPYLRGNLVSKRLDFDDLAGFVGAAPQTGGNESSNPKLAAKAAQQKARDRVLPDTPYELDKLRSMDADVRWKAQRINAPKLPLDDMDVHFLLENGVLQLKPLNFGVAGGDIRSDIRMDARQSPIRTKADINASGLKLGSLFPDAKLAQDATGNVGGKITLSGTGNSIAAMLGSSDGDAALGMGRGQISNLLLEFAGLDIAETLKFLVKGDRKIPIRCAFGDFSVKDGVMTSRALAFDTTDTIIVGEGSISLKDETLDLKLRPRPKDRSLLVFRSPLLVDGTFKHPDFHPDLARVGLRGAIALVLGSIAPPIALLATLELGPGKDANCGGKYAK